MYHISNVRGVSLYKMCFLFALLRPALKEKPKFLPNVEYPEQNILKMSLAHFAAIFVQWWCFEKSFSKQFLEHHNLLHFQVQYYMNLTMRARLDMD